MLSGLGSLADWIWLRKESLSLRICQEKLPRRENKVTNTEKKKQKKILRNCGTTTKSIAFI